MVLPKNSTTNCFGGAASVAGYVSDRVLTLKPGSQLTMTITRGKSADFSVRTVIEGSSDVTEKTWEEWPYY